MNYFKNITGNFIFEDDDGELSRDNWVDVLIGDDNFGSVWFNTIQNKGIITQGCDTELSLDKDFMREFEQVIPIVIPKIFSEVVLDYFNSKIIFECDCIEFPHFSGKYDEDGSPIQQVYRYSTKKQ